MPKEVDALRTSLDSRLTALEQALADPRQHGSLESLILDLARIATEEADATARHAVLAAERAGQDAVAAARTEAAAALEAEKVESAALRQVIEDAKSALKKADAALKEERRATEAANRQAAGAQRELEEMRESLEQQQSASSNQRRELDAALAAVDGERARASALEQQVAQARQHGESERAGFASELEHERAALAAERAAAAQLLQTSSDLEQQLATVRGELDASRRELEATRGERDSTRRDLDAARRELDGLRLDSDARTQTLSQSQAEHEQALIAARDAARSAEARLEQESRERDAAHEESAELKRQLELAEDAIRDRDAALQQMQAAHEARDAADVLEAARNDQPHAQLETDAESEVDLTAISMDEERQLASEKRTRALELALRDAEMRAESLERELDSHRRAAPAAPAAPPTVSAAAAATPQGSEQFRGPAREAKRVAFTQEPDIQVDGAPGKLVDLSLTGAQLLTPSAINPNRLVTVTLTMNDSTIPCKAKVMWSRLEPRSGQLWYRAGVCFTTADQLALETILNGEQK